jgi:hypothetical protein
LLTHCHAFPCDCGHSFHLVLDSEELVAVFKEFSSVLFCKALLEKPSPIGVEQWLFGTSGYRFHAPPAFLDQLYRKTMTLDKFTALDFDCIFRGLSIRRLAYYYAAELASGLSNVSTHVSWQPFKSSRIHDLN